MRVLSFDNSFSPQELAEALLAAGYARGSTLGDIVSGKVDEIDDCDDEISLRCAIDEDEAVNGLSEEAILAAADGLRDDHEQDIEDGIYYARHGNRSLALAMFERVFDGPSLAAAERGLNA